MRHSSQAETISPEKRDPNRPTRMLTAYLCNISRGPEKVRSMIMNDIRVFSALGADEYVCDLEAALRLFDRACAEAA